jgi:hypothetical protein
LPLANVCSDQPQPAVALRVNFTALALIGCAAVQWVIAEFCEAGSFASRSALGWFGWKPLCSGYGWCCSMWLVAIKSRRFYSVQVQLYIQIMICSIIGTAAGAITELLTT